MSNIDPITKKLCVELIERFVRDGHSLTLSKRKGLRFFKIDDEFEYEITSDPDYQAMKKKYFNRSNKRIDNFSLQLN